MVERLLLQSYVSAGPDRASEPVLLASWLERGEISTVVLDSSIPGSDAIHSVLRAHGFAPTVAYGYAVYRR